MAVGLLSATLGLPDFKVSAENLRYQARASLETPLLGGKLYLAADKDGLPTSETVYQRYSVYGDSSTESTPAARHRSGGADLRSPQLPGVVQAGSRCRATCCRWAKPSRRFA